MITIANNFTNKFISVKELTNLMREMERAAKLARVNSRAGSCTELASGLRITCQDAELHFETFVGFDRPIILSTVLYGHPPLPFSCIVSRSMLAKLCRAIARTGIKAIIISGSEAEIEIRSPEAGFCYRLTAFSNPENFPVNRLQYHGVPCNNMNIDTEATTLEPIMITVTNHYFTDLEAAITAGAIIKNGKNPKKVDLYEAIAAHNQAVEVEPAQSEQPATVEVDYELELQERLLSMDAIEDAAKKEKEKEKAKVKPVGQTRIGTSKSLAWDEIFPAERIGFINSGTFNAATIERMFNGGIRLEDWQAIGLSSKRQVSQAIACISEKGYGIHKENDTYTVILPEGLTAPKIK